jgi:hypothetical protein
MKPTANDVEVGNKQLRGSPYAMFGVGIVVAILSWTLFAQWVLHPEVMGNPVHTVVVNATIVTAIAGSLLACFITAMLGQEELTRWRLFGKLFSASVGGAVLAGGFDAIKGIIGGSSASAVLIMSQHPNLTDIRPSAAILLACSSALGEGVVIGVIMGVLGIAITDLRQSMRDPLPIPAEQAPAPLPPAEHPSVSAP